MNIHTASPQGQPPLVVLCLDTGDSELITRWASEGHLPTIASIMERGSWARTGGPELISEHGVWVSLFSGVSRAEHGYHYFRQLEPGTYNLVPVAGSEIDVDPFWSCLRDSGRRVAIIDVPDTDLVPGLDGVQLTNWATHGAWDPDHGRTATEPPELLDDIMDRFGSRRVPIEELEADDRRNESLLRELLSRTRTKGRLVRDLLSRGSFDLAVVMFSECHAANHQFWRYSPDALDDPADVPPDSPLPHAIRDVYRALDDELGLILDQFAADSNVFLVTSVGMEDDFPTAGLTEAFCRKFGYQTARASGASSLRPLDILRRFMPESLRVALSRGLSRSHREKLLADAFRNGTDWSKTEAFAIPTFYTSFVRVNLRGREPEGTVESGHEYTDLLERVERDLYQLIDPVTGRRAVKKITRTVDLFDCAPHPVLPDLFVEWQSGRFIDRVDYPGGSLSIPRPEFFRRSDHSAVGFVAAAGPSIARRGELGPVDVLQLAPTFLALIGESVPNWMSGHRLAAFMRAG